MRKIKRYVIKNKGYSEAGASYTKRSLKGFTATSGSAREDIDANNKTLRQRARMLYMSAPIATSAIRTNRTNVVGVGLKLKSRIDRNILNMTPEEADAWEKKTEAEFALWAENKRSCDATGVNDFYSMQQLAMISWLMSGDSFCLIKQAETFKYSPYSLRLHIIEADRVSTPADCRNKIITATEGETKSGNRIFDGVEVDKNGAIVAYHICNSYGSELLLSKQEWTRVEAYGAKSELPNILQIMDSERPEQYRGVSYLAHIIEPLQQLKRYTESEIMAAVVQSFFTAFIKTDVDPTDNPLNVASGEGQTQVSSNPNDYEMGPGFVNFLQPGEDVFLADPKHPKTGFGDFVRAIVEQIGAALEIPADLLLKAFNASYSASRAALLEAWKAFRMRRTWFVADFCKPAYEIWLSEAIARGRIAAPGFFVDPLIRSAYLGALWTGPSQGQLDPVKEVTAEILAIENGLTTHEEAAIRMNGGSHSSIVEQLAIENQRLAEAKGLNNPADLSNGNVSVASDGRVNT